MRILFLLVFSLFLGICTKAETLKTVSRVDLKKYAGKWYEIASYPEPFQKNCHCTTAEYTVSKAGYVIVENRCHKGSCKGKLSAIKGKAVAQKNSGNAKLKVQFFWPFEGDYWIIDLADDYSYAVVSHPNRRYLWILSRKPKLDSIIYQQILARLKEKGFNLKQLQMTEQI